MHLDAFPDGVLVADAKGIVVRANPQLGRLLGRDQAELIGTHLKDALALDDLGGNTWFDCVRPYTGFENRTRISEGSWFTQHGRELLLTAALIRERPRGVVEQVIVSARDARARAARDREHSDLIATVAHELRSPLTGVKGFTATLLSNWERFSDEQRQLILATIDHDADRLGRLIAELLDAARIDSGRLTLRPQPLELAVSVQSVLDNLAAGSGQALRVEADGEVPTVWADEDRLAQVITNVVENGLRHGTGIDRIRVRGSRRGGAVVDVEDRGPGIPPEHRRRVFNRFWKSGERGESGLGLYIVAGIVARHGGTVTIHDRDAGGARISIWLPVNEPA